MYLADQVRHCSRDVRGNVAFAFAFGLPMLLGGAGLAVDMTNMMSERVRLQNVADGAALAAARELRIANVNKQTVIAVAGEFVQANAQPHEQLGFAGSVSNDKTTVSVTVDKTVPTYVMRLGGETETKISATAQAKVLGGAPLCLLGLNSSEKSTVGVDRAKITATSCAVYSNSSAAEGMRAKNSGSIDASFICSAGGASGSGFTPQPQLDCPVTPDPLAGRQPPKVGGCRFVNATYSFGVVTLLPGVYCGGLTIKNKTVAILLPGEYIIKDGPLDVDGESTLTGVGVGFYLTGANATFNFGAKTTISLTAPILGPLAGMLFFEDRDAPAGAHKINSRNAPVLLGTFYLPKSTLHVGAPGGPGLVAGLVGALSAWTIIIAQEVSINDGLNLKLNTDYSASKVPVPAGAGPNGAKVMLAR